MIQVLHSHLLRQQNIWQNGKLNIYNKNKTLKFFSVLVTEKLSCLQKTWIYVSLTKSFVVISEYPVVTQHQYKSKSKIIPVLFLQAYAGNRGASPLIFKLLNTTFIQ